MADREKVIKALEFCTDQRIVDTCYGECPYAVADDEYKCLQMKLDALSLLKEQEGLMLALEQSNAANEYLNAEVERLTGLLKEQEAVEFAREFMSDAVHETAKEFRQTIVRCKDCKHRPTYPKAYGAEINGKWCYWCELNRGWKHDDWFCADGERR